MAQGSGDEIFDLGCVHSTNIGAKLCPVSVGTEHILALVDSGADLSIVSAKVLKKIKPHLVKKQTDSKQTLLRSVTGDTLIVLGLVQIHLSFGNQKFWHHFHVIENTTKKMILESDFLFETGATIDLRGRTLALGSEVVLLKDKSYPQGDCMIVNTVDKVVLNPRCITYVKVRRNKALTGTCLVSPLENSKEVKDQPCILIPNILSQGGRYAIIPVVNETTARFVWKRNVPIALMEKLAEAEVSEITTNTSPTSEIEHRGPKANLDHVPWRQRTKVETLLQKYQNLFSKGDTDLGRTNVVSMKVDTGNHPPVKQKPYRTPFAEKPMVEQQLADMLTAGVVSPSSSPWASPIVVVPKKDSTKRVCVDYRKGVNKVLVQNSYPLPNIDLNLSLI